MQSYDYARRSGVESISWDKIAELAQALAEKLAAENIDAILGIARADYSLPRWFRAPCGGNCTRYG